MSNQIISLTMPDDRYDRIHQLAESESQSVETVLLRRIEESLMEPPPPLPPDEQAELDALQHLSDDALWTIAREQMPQNRQNRMQILMDGNTRGTLSETERRELEHLVEQGQKLMLRKAKAAALLTERGHKVTPELMDE